MLCVGGMRATLLLFGSPPQSGDAAADYGERQYCMHVTEQQNHLYPMSYVHALHNVSFFKIPNVKPYLFIHPNPKNAVISWTISWTISWQTITIFLSYLVWYDLQTNSPTNYSISWIWMSEKIGLDNYFHSNAALLSF